MKKNTLKALVVLALLFSTTLARAYQFDQFSDPYYEMVNEVFDKESAYNTVAFVEKYWRAVGNEGFNQSIYHVAEKLKKAGFVEEGEASDTDRLVYRIEKKPLRFLTWQPVSATLSLSSGEKLLDFKTNRNMIAMNSYSLDGEQEFEVIYLGKGRSLNLDQDMEGKIAFAERPIGSLFRTVVTQKKAAGVMAYSLPGYTQPEQNVNSIQFSAIPRDSVNRSFGILLSFQAKEKLMKALESGNGKVKVRLETKIYKSEELTLVAELRGSKVPDERFVFSAHVQEPGANDNASGVGALMEVARASAKLLGEGKINPERTITYLFGDEISSTRRFIKEDLERAKGIKWGMSLDMVGENTAITGGSFLIEKMPDPGAIWVRGVEKHSEWGGSPLKKSHLKPHYFNDLTIQVFKSIGEKKNWEVNFNPFEGGSDHVPFLEANIPGLLLWHFTDQFYHTDQDRLDKVSKETLKNVGTGALMIALMLTENKPMLADMVLLNSSTKAAIRLQDELRLSQQSVADGGDKEKEMDILNTWIDYYDKVFETTLDIGPKNGEAFKKNLEDTRYALIGLANMLRGQLR